MKSIQTKIIAHITSLGLALQIITCSQVAQSRDYALPFLASAGQVEVQKSGFDKYIIKTSEHAVSLELDPNNPELLKINNQVFRVNSKLSEKQNFERLKEMLQATLSPKGQEVAWHSKVLRVIFPEAHAISTLMIVAGIAAVAAIIWAISASKKAKNSETRRDASRERLQNIRGQNAELREELHSEASTYRESCLASAESSHDAQACRMLTQVN